MAPKITPWAVNGESEPSLRERIAQITAERGHFRNITEESLRAEMAAEESGQPSQSASGDEEEEGEQDEDGQPATRQGKQKWAKGTIFLKCLTELEPAMATSS